MALDGGVGSGWVKTADGTGGAWREVVVESQSRRYYMEVRLEREDAD